MIGRKFKVTRPRAGWPHSFTNAILEICEGHDPNHFQYPAMTKYGRTWFDKDCVELLPE